MPLFPETDRIFAPHSDFSSLKQEVWDFQYENNLIIRKFCELLGQTGPVYLPIRFFKDFALKTQGDWQAETIFGSSGTTGQVRSQHHVRQVEIYQNSLLQGFHHFYPNGQYAIFALLPNYLERADSSLVYMVRHWIATFGLPQSGFFLHDHAALHLALQQAVKREENILLIGVSFALLDFVEKYQLQLPPNSVVMETGGMKGNRKELIRTELHSSLNAGLGLSTIHSEYGMTELLSQAYVQGGNRFLCPPWMRVHITDPYVPGQALPDGRTGRINITDLANVYSCSFIQTDDLGKMHPDGSFEVLGRIDHAEMRGCNLMLTD